MSRAIIDKSQIGSDTKERLEKLVPEITDILFDRGHRINLSLVKDIAEIIYVKENRAFYIKDMGKL